MTRPLFSIVVPTRDRPGFLRDALQSARVQTCADFEVIVSDNFVEKPARQVFDECADGRFRYVRPPQQMSMADHWEFATSQARGEYITVLIDKTVLLPSILESVRTVMESEPADFVSWWNESYNLDYEHVGDYQRGSYGRRYAAATVPVQIDTQAELRRRYSLDVRRGSEGVNYFYGKICFGVYSRALVQRIVDSCGRLFRPISPDYTSMLPALALARRGLDFGRAGVMSINGVGVSNGGRYASDARHALRFMRSSGTEFTADHWPIANLFASHHNAVAFDYLQMQRYLAELGHLQLNMPNLLLRVREDMDAVASWPDEATKQDQYGIWQRALTTLEPEARAVVERAVAARLGQARDPVNVLRHGLARFKDRVRQAPGALALYRLMAGNRGAAREFTSVIDAAAFADLQYTPGKQGNMNGPRMTTAGH